MTFVRRRRRPDRGRAGGRTRRDRPRHAPPRLPIDPPARRPDHPHRGDGSDPADLPTRSLALGASGSSSGSASIVRTRTRVVYIDDSCVRVDGRRRRASRSRPGPSCGRRACRRRSSRRPSAAATGAETDRAGRIVVRPDLTIPGHPEIFVIGDAAIQPWKPDRPVPGVAQGGIQGGTYAAAAIRRRLSGEAAPAVPLPRQRRRRGHRAAGRA